MRGCVTPRDGHLTSERSRLCERFRGHDHAARPMRGPSRRETVLGDVGIDEHHHEKTDLLLLWRWALAKPVGAERWGCCVGAVRRTDEQYVERRRPTPRSRGQHAASALLLIEGTVLSEADARGARRRRRRHAQGRGVFSIRQQDRPVVFSTHSTRPCVRAARADAHGRRAGVVPGDGRGDANGGNCVTSSRHLLETRMRHAVRVRFRHWSWPARPSTGETRWMLGVGRWHRRLGVGPAVPSQRAVTNRRAASPLREACCGNC